ncbi:alkaline-phosphatase-like protein [Poronia punctata]|nr:alkaline-phosphatase-like protein [Poronia punctata]
MRQQILTFSFLAALGQSQSQAQQTSLTLRRPNVVFILTDDQDVRLGSLDYMPHVRKHLIERGTFYGKHYCTTAICCPSRVNLWTGKLPHNTNVTDVNPPYGGYPKFISQGFNTDYLPVWLQDGGYNTYYTGKLFNAHTVDNYDSPFPGGFTGWDFLLDPHTYDYMNSTFQRNNERPRSYEGLYGTDVLAAKALDFLDEGARDAENDNKPFFLTVAPVAPHSNMVVDKSQTAAFSEPIAAERHRHLFKDVKVPRTENFNPEHPSGANWLLDLPRQNQSNIEYNDHFYRQRLRALQSVDELVDAIVTRLAEHGILENTYIVYSSDNGFHVGQHRLQPGKTCGYEEDINVPLIVRGPGVAINHHTADHMVTTHTDLAPTFLQLLGIPLRADFDGRPIPVTRAEIGRESKSKGGRRRREHASVEYWGLVVTEGIHQPMNRGNNTYKAVRLSGDGYDLYYSVWCTNEHELYDMTVDPGQMHNLLLPQNSKTTKTRVAGHPVENVASRLDALLFVLKSCRGATCHEPWEQLHPTGDVHTLAEALHARFDEIYSSQSRRTRRVRYEYCADGYLLDAEGPMWDEVEVSYLRDGVSWDEWV